MILFKKKYDLIFSLGAACASSQNLRKCKLQKFSYPLDWLYGSDFSGRIDLLISNFKDFINKEDLEYTNTNNGDQKNLCDIYKNIKNMIVFNHDFPADIPLEESYQDIREKYDRRIKRLIEQINNSRSVLLVYAETPNWKEIENKQSLLKANNKLKKAFPNTKIDIIYIIQSKTEEKIQINENIKIIKNDYKSKKPNAIAYAFDHKALRKIFKIYSLNTFFFKKLKSFLKKETNNDK